MGFRKKIAHLDLVTVLLLTVFLELALNRLAVPVLRPPGNAAPPTWHRDLDRAGLFAFYLATFLALGVGLLKTWEFTVGQRGFSAAPRAVLATVCGLFFALAGWAVLGGAQLLSFHLESVFSLVLLVVSMAAASRAGDARIKLGLLLIAVPFLLHYYGTFALRVLVSSELAQGSSLPDRLRDAGQWSIALSATAVAVCFAPRPLLRSLFRPGPLVVAGFVGAVIAVVMFRHQEVGMEIASKGLGIDFGPASPAPVVAAFVLAAMAVAWTLTSTLTSPLPAHRLLGSGFALVVLGGYAFAWPLELITVVAGVLAITDAAARIPIEEAARGWPPPPITAPAIAEAVWHGYLGALAAAVHAEAVDAEPDQVRVRGVRKEIPFEINVLRPGSEIRALEVAFGGNPEGTAAWTLFARPEGVGVALHPPPPAADGRVFRSGDLAFDRRFRVVDSGGWTDRLLDADLRARAAALLDGWVAVWPDGALRYRVFPGRGAPLDHPIPQTELAFRGGEPAAATERLVRVFELLAELAARAHPT